jgi:hypothetical protein
MNTMGLYDHVSIADDVTDPTLKNFAGQHFQTYDLGNRMLNYIITSDMLMKLTATPLATLDDARRLSTYINTVITITPFGRESELSIGLELNKGSVTVVGVTDGEVPLEGLEKAALEFPNHFIGRCAAISKEIGEWCECKPVEAVANIPALLEELDMLIAEAQSELEEPKRLQLGTFVCSVEDENCDDIGIIAYDHMEHGVDFYSVCWLKDRHLSSRDTVDLKVLDGVTATKAFCKNSIEYH